MQPTPTSNRRRLYSIILASLLLLGGGVGAYHSTGQAQASTSLELGSLSIADADQQISGDVQDVRLQTRVDYSHDVQDAERRIVYVYVGPSEGDLELLTYSQTTDLQGTESGSVTLTDSLLSHSAWDAQTFDPALASNKSTTVVVRAVIEIQRENGETETQSVTDEATITLRDGATLSVEVGGSGGFVVESG